MLGRDPMPRFGLKCAGSWLLAAGLGVVSAAQAPVWTHQGPQTLQSASWGALGGPIYSLALAPDGSVYAGGAGGVWRFDGTSWTSLTPGQPVAALTLSQDGTLYAGTGLRSGTGGIGILASHDAGATWQALAGGALSGLVITRIGVDPANASHLLAATAAPPGQSATPGLYSSADGGATWSGPLVPGSIEDLAWSGASVLAVGSSSLALSSNDGATFATLSLAAVPASWSRAAVCFQPGAGFLALFQGGAASLAAISLDGQTATAIPMPGDWTASATGALSLAADAGDIWVGSSDVWASAAGGAWSNLTHTGLPGASIHPGQQAILPVSGGGLWIANDGGVWRQPAAAGAWTNENLTLANASPLALALTPGGMVAALDGGGIATGTASAWTVSAGNAAMAANLLAPDPADASGQSLFAAASAGLWHSTNNGANWTTIPVSSSAPITALAANGSGAILGTAAGQLLQAGGTIASPAVGQAITALAATPDGKQLWVAAHSGLWTSTDAGLTWLPLSLPFGPPSALAAASAQPGLLAAATPQGVAVSTDGGNGWSLVDGGLSAAPVTRLAFDKVGNLWASTLGRGTWSLALVAPSFKLSLSVSPATAPAGDPVQFQLVYSSALGPVAGAAVTVSSSEGNVQGTSVTAVTDANGTASGSLPLSNQAGTVTVVAAVATGSGVITSAPQTVLSTAGAPAHLTVLSGAGQQQTVGGKLALPVVLQVTDALGNGVPGVAVAIQDGSGFQATLTTGAQGEVALVGYLVPTTPQTVTLHASAGSLTASWSETALPAPDYRLVLTAPAAPVAPNGLAVLQLQVVAIGGFDTPVPLLCSPIPGCSIVENGAVVTSLAPGAAAQVDFGVGAAGAGQSSVVVSVAGDATHVANATVLLQTLSVTLSTNSINLQAGASTVVPVTVSAVNGLTGPVTLSAGAADGSALPSSLTVQVNPATLSLSANATSGAAQLQLSASSSGVAPGPPRWPRWPAALLFTLAGACLALRPRTRRTRGARRRALALACMAMALAGCGGNPSADPPPDPPAPQTTVVSLTITAASAGLQISVPVTLDLTSP